MSTLEEVCPPIHPHVLPPPSSHSKGSQQHNRRASNSGSQLRLEMRLEMKRNNAFEGPISTFPTDMDGSAKTKSGQPESWFC
mmetsp:Transcript_43876/g.73991  ORF Transcript_43876/g.73991 Transcript_43876/m.73991 type:complete len:82 (+) Transcript_43876:761-1006(+)